MEGPSLLILREELEPFVGKKVLRVSGNTKQPKKSLSGRKLSATDSWGKNLFLTFEKKKCGPVLVKFHFLMWGSYRINEKRPGRVPRLQLKFSNGTLYFYACSIRFDAEEYFQKVDRKVDLLSAGWDEEHVLQLMKKHKSALLCDLFLDQSVFAGSGNIIKNEVLFNLRRHPLTKLSEIPMKDWKKLVYAVREYSWNFYTWKKKFELKRHWQIYRKSFCPVCDTKIVRKHVGKFKRRTFFCPVCQSHKKKKLEVHSVLPVRGPFKPEIQLDH